MDIHDRFGVSQEQLDSLIGTASRKLGKSPEEICRILESERAQKMLNNLTDKQTKGAREVLANPKKVEQLLSNPIVRGMIAKYLKEK